MIDSKTFTNGSDKDAVKALFRKMSINQLGGIEELIMHGMKPPTIEDARRFGGCLNLFATMSNQSGCASCGMSDEACKVMFSTLSSGA